MVNSVEDLSPTLQVSYQQLFELNPLPIWIYDANTLRILAVNTAALARYDYSREAFLGLTLPDISARGDVASSPQQLHRCRNGDLVEVEAVTAEIGFEGAQAHMVVVTALAAQRRADQAGFDLRLFQEQQVLATIVNTTSNAFITVGVDGMIELFNPAAEHIFRRSREEMQGKTLELLMPDRFRLTHAKHRVQFSDSQESSRMMGLGLVKGLRSDGQELDLEGSISQVTVDKRKVIIVILKDVSERVQIEAGLAHSRAQLSDLTQRLMSQEKVLVKRLAQALHDHLGQTMAAIRMTHETIMALQKDKVTPDVDRFQHQMEELISQAIRQIRQVLIDLRPPLLEDHGLAAALDNELRNRSLTQPQVDISITVSPDVGLLRWPSEVEYAAFMVVREAVENALRHSGASSVGVRIIGAENSLHLEVADDGCGLPSGDVKRTGHLGILGMQERAQAVGATVTVESVKDGGARVHFNWGMLQNDTYLPGR